MTSVLIRNAQIWDADSGSLFPGAVEINGSRIGQVHRQDVAATPERNDVIDAGGSLILVQLA